MVKDNLNIRLGTLSISVGGFSERPFHKSTRTLIVTDTVVSVATDAPPIIQQDPRALLYHAQDYVSEIIQDTVGCGKEISAAWCSLVGILSITHKSSRHHCTEILIWFEERNLGEGAIPGGAPQYPVVVARSSRTNAADAISEEGRLFCSPFSAHTGPGTGIDTGLGGYCDAALAGYGPRHFVSLEQQCAAENSQNFIKAFDMLRSRPGDLRPQRALGRRQRYCSR
jgi:hypothetical protein